MVCFALAFGQSHPWACFGLGSGRAMPVFRQSPVSHVREQPEVVGFV